eukprot:COSAG01_NODE_9254_length_2498_cov_3.106533_3_plen_173_part_00
MSAAQQPVHYDILSLRVQRRQQGKAGAGAVCWCAAAALLAGFCECGARAEMDPPAAVGAIPSPQLPPFPPRCLSVPCCLRSLPLVRLTFLPPASAAAVRRLTACVGGCGCRHRRTAAALLCLLCVLCVSRCLTVCCLQLRNSCADQHDCGSVTATIPRQLLLPSAPHACRAA